VSLCLCAALIAPIAAAETKDERDARMQWWREARFGLFVHFGLYAIPAGEWNGKKIGGGGEWIMNDGHIPLADYEKLQSQFNPEKFDAKAWVKLAHDAGMKYIVITSKHHDGFCLWPSKVSEYTIANTPFKRDILKELANACKADGTVRFCIYHSIMDWHHPDAQAAAAPNYNPGKDYQPNPNFPRYVESYLKPQLKELIENYDPGVIWFDGEWVPEYTPAMGQDLYAYCRSINPKIIVNNRVGKSRKGLNGMSDDKDSPGDFGTPEQNIPATGLPGIDWESCMTMNETWGYKKDDNKWKSSQSLVRNLVEIASKGGNYLLNVGPNAKGEIPAESIKRLTEIGKWMQKNGDSIHAASASPFKKLFWGKATTGKDGTLYLHVFVWPNGGDLIVPMTNNATSAMLVSNEKNNLTTSSETDGLHVKGLPVAAPDGLDTVVALKLDGPVKPLDTSIRQGADGSLALLAIDCDVHATNAKLEKKGDHPYNIGYWTNVKDTVTWETTIDKPRQFSVDLEYSLGSPPPGSEIHIEFGNEPVIAVRLEPTKDFLDFHTIGIGQITLPAGPITITLRPMKKAGVAVMDLRRIELKPVK
jgi:alpha-L-fucosidase